MQSSLLRPDRKLRLNEKHFQGYWVQLNTLIRRNEHADELLDGVLTNPMLDILPIVTNNHHAHHGHAEAVRLLYVAKNLGNPPGTFPDPVQLEHDPIGCIRDFTLATKAGTRGGLNPDTGNAWGAAKAWAKHQHAANIIYRGACKHIWETAVATLSAEEAITVIGGLPYGAGPTLLEQIRNLQQRQTTMALFTLFSQLISLQLRSGERVASLHGRMLEIRTRLANWDPPIILPDKLLIVCLIRLLPRQFHATRTIIMSRKQMSLAISRDMLLDVENRDAERITMSLGSKPTVKPQQHATALVSKAGAPKRKFKKKKKPKKSEKYHTEGACSHHGANCSHASSECFILHPELKPTAAVADEAAALAVTTLALCDNNNPKPFGFMNEDWGFALTLAGEEVNTANDQHCDVTLIPRRGAHVVGKLKRCSNEPDQTELPHSLLRPDTEGRLRPLQPKGTAKIVVEQVSIKASDEGLTSYPGGVQSGGAVSPHVDSCPIVDTFDHNITYGINSVDIGPILMVPRAIVNRDHSLLTSDVRGELPLSVSHLVRPMSKHDMCDKKSDTMDEAIQDKVSATRNTAPIDMSTQNKCAAIIQWLVTIANVPHWKVVQTLQKENEVLTNTGLRLAIKDGAGAGIWLWTQRQCQLLSTKVAIKLIVLLQQEYIHGTTFAAEHPELGVSVHIDPDGRIDKGYITTAALMKLQLTVDKENDMWHYDLAPDVDTVTTNLVVNPRRDWYPTAEGKIFKDVRLHVVDSSVPAIVLAGIESILMNDYCSTFTNGKPDNDSSGYALMMTTNREEGAYAFMMTDDDKDPEPRFVTERDKDKDKHAYNIYKAWACRHPQRARNQNAPRNMSDQLNDAGEVIEALTPSDYGPAPMKFRAAKGLQKLMTHERTKANHSEATRSVAVSDAATSSAKSQKTKRRKKFKGHGWSKKNNRRQRSNKKSVKSKVQHNKNVHSYNNIIKGSVVHNGKVQHHHAQRRLARTGGVHDLTAEHELGASRAVQLQQPNYVPFESTQDMLRVNVRYEFSDGLTTVMPLKHGCPRAAVSSMGPTPPVHNVTPTQHVEERTTPPDNIMYIPVDVPGHFKMVLRLCDVPLPGVSAVTIPGSSLMLQVHHLRFHGKALVTSPEDNHSNTVLDSGATEHISPKVKGPLTRAPISSIHGLSGAGTPITGMGTVNKVNNVMCCPGSSRRLLSVARLLEQLGGKMVFTTSEAYHVDGKTITPIAVRDGKGLYKVTSDQYNLNAQALSSALVGNSVSTDLARERITSLHRAFGHASKEALRTILKQHNFRGVLEHHLQLLQPCNACMLGKTHRTAKGKLSTDKATTFGYRISADCCGPFRTQSISGAKYLLVVIDEFSSFTWVVPLPSLTTVDENLEHVIEVRLHQRDDTTVKVFRSDGGTEFVNQRVDLILAKHGIIREITCADSSFQNGKAERRIRTIFERVRTCLSDAGLPSGFWAEAAVYAAYTLNRTPVPRGTSPFFKRYGKHAKVSHLRPFGNPCVIYRKRSVAGKIEDAGVPGTFLGYGYIRGQKGYRARVGNTNKVSTCLDVVCGVYPSASSPVQLLNEDATSIVIAPESEDRPLRTPTIPDATATHLENAEATTNLPTPNATPTPNEQFTVGARVEGDWRGHGEYFEAVVTGVNKSGRRVTYDLVYTADNEAEPGVTSSRVRTRRAPQRSTSTGLCAHALVTDCNPAYIAHVPDFARQHITPKHYGEAMRSKDKIHWLRAIFEELKSVKNQGVYDFVAELPDGVKALGCLWVFKIKCGPDGTISRYKARITVNGKTQEYGINYSETFSPVAFATTIRLLLVMAVASSLQLRQFDIKCAFLYAKLPQNERVYMRAPPGYGRKGYWHLSSSLYGLKQSPRLFNQHLNNTLQKMGWESCAFDPCLYRHQKGGAYLVVVVDDMILASPSDAFTKSFYTDMRKAYDIKDLGVPKYVIGVRIQITANSLKMVQDRYITDLYEQHTPGDRATSTPAIPNVTLCLDGIHGEDKSPLLLQPKTYRSLVGGLMYALITRPDIATAVSMCARYLAQPRQAHLEAAQRVLRYLHHTKTLALVYNKFSLANFRITAFADSSWANDVDTRRSRYGYALYVGSALVSWRSKLHNCVALSTAEAEYCAATEAAKNIKWVASLIRFMLPKVTLPPAVMYEDNAACRTMVTCAQISGRNKHFELKQHFIRELYKHKVFRLLPISTIHQIADIFTKALARPAFETHRSSLLNGISLKYIMGATTEGGC